MRKIEDMRSAAGIFIIAVSLCLLPASARAQGARLRLGNLDKLSVKATAVSDVSLDGQLLQLATAFMKLAHDPKSEQVFGVIKDIKGIYVRNYVFAEPNQYSQEDVEAIRVQLSTPGWNRIAGTREKSGAVNEVYLMKEGENVTGIAVLSAEPKQLSIVNIVGPLDLTKLGALAGNFGIPGNIPSGAKPAVPNENPTAIPYSAQKNPTPGPPAAPAG